MKKSNNTDTSPVFIIAEAGVNHNGDVDIARQLIDVAVEAKADAVKFQTFRSENIVTIDGKKAWHQKRAEEKTQFSMLKNLELTYDEFLELKSYCDRKNIEFMSTPYDADSVLFLDKLVSRFKLPSADIINRPLLESVAATKKQVIMSTGMASMDEIGNAIALLHLHDVDDIVLLHCTTSYPAPYNQLHLRFMNTLREQFDCPVGYSDHSEGIEIPVMAVSMGAMMLEKHFTLDRDMSGPDHFASLEPDELKSMVQSIRHVEQAFGTKQRFIGEQEQKNLYHLRRSMHWLRDMKEGEQIQKEDIGILRPNVGLSPWRYDDIIGEYVKEDVKRFEPVKEEQI